MGLWSWLGKVFRRVRAWLAYNPELPPPPPEAPKVDELPPPAGGSGGAGVGYGTATAKTWTTAKEKAQQKKPPPKPKKAVDPWDTGELLTLSPEELRARAMHIQPWKTQWIGRVDVIPPESDERTALVDRGLVLRGFFTEAELAEIHAIGDAWLEHKDAARLARARAAKDVDAALAQLRAEERERKARKKREAAERRERRAREIAERRRTDIVFLGRGVSHSLADRRAHVEKLEARGLPVLATPKDVADALGLPIPRLRFLAHHDEALQRAHYVQFEVPKRTGGMRTLAAPKPDLAKAQTWILEHVLAKVPVHDAAHGFVPGRSTATCARPHRGRAAVVNLDLKDFFPSITFPRVRGVFAELGYSPAAATILALLCTECPRREVRFAGVTYHVAVGERGLPQGACTSPALSNLVARRLDARLAGLAEKRGFAYTRYADDLSFSTGDPKAVAPLLAIVRKIVREEGFRENGKKTRVQRAAGRQTVTGLVVNEPDRLGLPREEVRRLRAILHNAKKTGLAAQNRGGHPDFEAHLRGKIAYLAMVDAPKAARFRAELDALTG